MALTASPSAMSVDGPYRPVAVNWQAGQASMRPMSSKAKGKRPMHNDEEDASYDEDQQASLFAPLQKRLAASLQASTSSATQIEPVPEGVQEANAGRPVRARRKTAGRSFVDAYDPETTAAFEDHEMASSDAVEPAARRDVINDNDSLIDEEEDPLEGVSDARRTEMLALMRRLIRPYQHVNLPPLPESFPSVNPYMPLVIWPNTTQRHPDPTQPAPQDHRGVAANAGPSQSAEVRCNATENTNGSRWSCSVVLTDSDDDGDAKECKRRKVYTPPMKTTQWDRDFARYQASQRALVEYQEKIQRYNEQFPDMPCAFDVEDIKSEIENGVDAVRAERPEQETQRQERFMVYREQRELTGESSDTPMDTGPQALPSPRQQSPMGRRESLLAQPLMELQIGQAREESPMARRGDVEGTEGGGGAVDRTEAGDGAVEGTEAGDGATSEASRPSAVIDLLDRIYRSHRPVVSVAPSQQQEEARVPAEIDFPLPLEVRLPKPMPVPHSTVMDCCSCQPQPVIAPIAPAALTHPPPKPAVDNAVVRSASKDPQQPSQAVPGPGPLQPESVDQKMLVQSAKPNEGSAPVVAVKPKTFVRGFTDFIIPKRTP